LRLLPSNGCERVYGTSTYACCGRHAVVRGCAELAPGFRGRSEHVRRARATGQHAAGPVPDVRLAQPTRAAKATDERTVRVARRSLRSPGDRLGHALGHGLVWCSQFESEKPSGDAGFRPKVEPKTPRFPDRRRRAHPVNAPPTRASSNHAGSRALRWRDPDSNRGHHDFQSCGRGGRRGRNPWTQRVSARLGTGRSSSYFARFSTRFRRWTAPISSLIRPASVRNIGSAGSGHGSGLFVERERLGSDLELAKTHARTQRANRCPT
jgi:hypothetical protein